MGTTRRASRCCTAAPVRRSLPSPRSDRTIPPRPTPCEPSHGPRDTLELGWMPIIEAIRTSTAMTVWRHALGGDLQLTGRAGGVSPGSTVATWIATNGLDDLRDTEVVDRLHDTIERLRAAVAGGGDVDHAERRLAAFADEAVRRARHDRAGFAAVDDGTSRRSWCHCDPRRDRCPGRFVGTRPPTSRHPTGRARSRRAPGAARARRRRSPA